MLNSTGLDLSADVVSLERNDAVTGATYSARSHLYVLFRNGAQVH